MENNKKEIMEQMTLEDIIELAGKGFWEVSNAVEKTMDELNKYADYSFDEYADHFEILDPEFNEWIMDQVARIATEKFDYKIKGKSSDGLGSEYLSDL